LYQKGGPTAVLVGATVAVIGAGEESQEWKMEGVSDERATEQA
jgi:hypothetical protein